MIVFASLPTRRSLQKKSLITPLDPPHNAIAFEDLRTRLKHQSLLQDYEDLQKETEGLKEKLQMMKHRRFTLKFEVEFLRQRHQYLTQNSASKSYSEKNTIAPSRTRGVRKEPNPKGKKQEVKRANPKTQHHRHDSNKKRKTFCGEKEIGTPASVLDLNQIERISMESKTSVHPVPFPNMNQTQERTPVFDLNQISKEGIEDQLSDLERMVLKGGNKTVLALEEKEEIQSDLKLSLICRNVKNKFNQAEKRKVTWQDPVALSV